MLVSLLAAMATLWTASPTATEGMVLIGAGFGRTGTASTKKALELLDLGPTHHMSAVSTPCAQVHSLCSQCFTPVDVEAMHSCMP